MLLNASYFRRKCDILKTGPIFGISSSILVRNKYWIWFSKYDEEWCKHLLVLFFRFRLSWHWGWSSHAAAACAAAVSVAVNVSVQRPKTIFSIWIQMSWRRRCQRSRTEVRNSGDCKHTITRFCLCLQLLLKKRALLTMHITVFCCDLQAMTL